MAENYKDPIDALKEEFGERFKEMGNTLGKIQESTEPVAKVAKAQISHAHRPNAPMPRVELGKETRKDLLSALKDIRKQLVVSQPRETTMGGIAADVLASGGGLGEAAKTAIGYKVGTAAKSLKRKFDPLNIIHKITGGSKLITALAGRVMGRTEQSIRSSAGLAGGMDLGAQGVGTPSFMQDAPSYAPQQEHSGVNTSLVLLEKIASDVAKIADRVVLIQMGQDEGLEFAKKQLDMQKDTAALAGARRHPNAVPGKGMLAAVKTEEKAGFGFGKLFNLSSVGKWLSSIGGIFGKTIGFIGSLVKGIMRLLKFAGPWGLAIGLLVTAAALLYKNWDKLALSFELLKESAIDFWKGTKQAFSDGYEWIKDKAFMIADTFTDAMNWIGETVQEFLHKYLGIGEAPKTEQEKQRSLEERAQSGEGYAQRKLARQNANKIAQESEINTVTQSLASQSASNLPLSAAGIIQSAETKQMAIQSALGRVPPRGTPQQVQAAQALSQMAIKAYKKLYKDKQGNPLSPSVDAQAESRLPEVVDRAAATLSQSVTSATSPLMSPMAPVTPAMIPPAPTAGARLNEAADFKASSQMAAAATNILAPVVSNKSVTNNSQTIIQPMPGVRTDENSIQRSKALSFSAS